MKWFALFVLTLFALIYVSLSLHFETKKRQSVGTIADIIFYDARFKEVDTDTLSILSFAKRGEIVSNQIYMFDVNYKSRHIQKLKSFEAHDKGKMVALSKNIDVKTQSGYRLLTQKAFFEKKDERLVVVKPFVLFSDRIDVEGKRLTYDAKRHITVAKSVQATIRL